MTNDKSQMTGTRSNTTRNLLLIAILLIGAYLRFTGLNWDEGQWIHPDEGHMRIITSVVQMPDSLSLYFDTHNSPLNCRNSGHRYSYGTLPLFLTRMTAEWLAGGRTGRFPCESWAEALEALARVYRPRGHCVTGADAVAGLPVRSRERPGGTANVP